MHQAVKFLALGIFFLSQTRPLRAADIMASGRINGVGQSNVYLDKSNVADLNMQPGLDLAVDFGPFYSTGYNFFGQLSLLNPNLNAQWHQLYLFANPLWGKESQHEAFAEIKIDTLRVDNTVQVLNYLRPQLNSKIDMQVINNLQAWGSFNSAFRYTYDDPVANSLDNWLRLGLNWTLPWRMSVLPSMGYGLRYLPQQDLSVSQDQLDQQLTFHIRIGQALWKNAGLSIYYGYLWALDPSGLLQRKLSMDQYAYLGEDFFFSGHQAGLGFKQLLSNWGLLDVSIQVQQRQYLGWSAEDALAQSLGYDREDWRLVPQARFSLHHDFGEAEKAWRAGLNLTLAYTRQWSNSDWYDSDGLMLGINLFVMN